MTILEQLDDEQNAAVAATAKRVLVEAGAGTGKTRVLVARILHLVRDVGVDPSGIVAVTFTNRAAREIRGRLALALGGEAAGRIALGTFHSLSARLLRRNPAAAGLTRRFAVADEEDAERLVKISIEQCGAVGGADEAARARAAAEIAPGIAARIRSWKGWGLTSAMVEQGSRVHADAEEERAARVYVAYQHELARRDLVDFGDLVLLAVEMLGAHPDIAERESERVRHLLVDEAQDANPTQVAWARAMSREHGNVFVVGDEDQSIFSFQGGFPEALRAIAGEDAQRFALTRNRRCTDAVLAPAVTLVGWNRRASPKVLRSGRPGAAPEVRIFGSEREEAAAVAETVRRIAAKGTKPSEIAILIRSSWAMAPVEEAMIKANIPYEVVGGSSFAAREEVRDVLAYLRLAARPFDDLAFSRIVNKPTRGLGAAAEAAIMRRADQDEPFHEACMLLRAIGGVRLTDAMRTGLDGLGRSLGYLAKAYEKGDETTHLLEVILKGAGINYEAWVASHRDKPKRRRDSMKALIRIAEEEPDALAFVERVCLASEDDAVSPDKVRISTMHSSKGLEWDHVICPGFDAGVVPSPRALKERSSGSPGDPWNGPAGGGIAEERRLVHVAFTRARHQIHLSLPLTRAGKKVDPSVFLAESGLDPLLGGDSFEDGFTIGKSGGKSKARAGRKGFAPRGF